MERAAKAIQGGQKVCESFKDFTMSVKMHKSYQCYFTQSLPMYNFYDVFKYTKETIRIYFGNVYPLQYNLLQV